MVTIHVDTQEKLDDVLKRLNDLEYKWVGDGSPAFPRPGWIPVKEISYLWCYIEKGMMRSILFAKGIMGNSEVETVLEFEEFIEKPVNFVLMRGEC